MYVLNGLSCRGTMLQTCFLTKPLTKELAELLRAKTSGEAARRMGRR